MDKVTGITRVRNEALIIADTIKHFLEYCDDIILYDDCSEDDTVEIASGVGKDRITVIGGDEWRSDRNAEETRHRRILLEHVTAPWALCFDADERLVGELPILHGDGYWFRLFDGYITKYCRELYRGEDLIELPRMWGPEYRDILMLFRTEAAHYIGAGRREPYMRGSGCDIRLASDLKVKHYGKCLSVEHWEETCDYYAGNFPEPFRSKWAARRGKAIHTESDFGQPLFTWQELMTRREAWKPI